MARLNFEAFPRAMDANGDLASGAKLYVYEAGTTTPVTTYSDEALNTAQTHPIVADSSGFFPQIYVAEGKYRIVVTTAAGVTIDEVDDVSQGGSGYKTVAALKASSEGTRGTGAIWQAGGYRYEEQASNATADLTTTAGWPAPLKVLPGERGLNVKAFGAKGDGSTDDTSAIQAAFDAARASHQSAYVPSGWYITSAPITGTDVTIIGAVPAKTRVQWSYLGTADDKGFSVFVNTTTNMFDVSGGMVTSRNMAFLGQKSFDLAPTLYCLTSSGTGYFKVDAEYCNFTGFLEAVDLSRGSWVQRVVNCRLEQCDTGINATYAANASSFSHNSVYYCRKGIDSAGYNTDITWNEYGVNTDTDEICLQVTGSGFDVSHNYLEKYVGTGLANGGIGTIPIKYIRNRHDTREGRIELNNIDMHGDSDHGIWVEQASGQLGTVDSCYVTIRNNRIRRVNVSDVYFPSGTTLAMPPLFNNGDGRYTNFYKVVQDAYAVCSFDVDISSTATDYHGTTTIHIPIGVDDATWTAPVITDNAQIMPGDGYLRGRGVYEIELTYTMETAHDAEALIRFDDGTIEDFGATHIYHATVGADGINYVTGSIKVVRDYRVAGGKSMRIGFRSTGTTSERFDRAKGYLTVKQVGPWS